MARTGSISLRAHSGVPCEVSFRSVHFLRRTAARARMDIFSDPAYAMATEQFHLIADYLQMDENLRARMSITTFSAARALKIAAAVPGVSGI